MKITLRITQKVDLQSTDYFGVLYLLLPVVFFFAFYTIATIAIPSVAFLIYCVSRLRLTKSLNPSNYALLALNATVSVAVVISSGAAGPLYVNSDWYKHYAIFNELARHSTIAEQGFTLRYYIGAYIVPSFAEKVSGFSSGVVFASWISIGLFIFLNQLSSLIDSVRLRYFAPFLFLLFSGADIVGTFITSFQWGPIYHIEWWVGWIEYSSTITSLFWAPQSTLPAWISIAFLSRKISIEQKVFVYPIVLMCCLLWSPFAAIGIAPFIFLALADRKLISAEISLINVAGVALLSAMLCYYLTFDVDKIPKHWVWNNPCLISSASETCFSIKGYVLFVFLEVLPIWAIAIFYHPSRKEILNTALALLLLMPFVQLGLANDLAMNASKPAIAALVIGLIISLQGGHPIRAFLVGVIFAAGVATPLGEILRSFKLDRAISSDIDVSTFVKTSPEYASQYVTEKKIWFLREE